jgi:hypothetical protein
MVSNRKRQNGQNDYLSLDKAPAPTYASLNFIPHLAIACRQAKIARLNDSNALTPSANSNLSSKNLMPR